ncbi:hypothetical protein OF117_17615 [Geodermatophilus sp. YIM 151500]|uniref:hypothetical protein n=1 Tax=Geodermatophilus sp. YIM 151500 TaxID=2984531 RepID=UPI0021E409C3|nr:hypothetical protein [Geodermatophilus sp. YIM 151500]MCV2491169.1 hypothetical protein [Geodermatophilus sp. YIM 151500]
MTTSVAQRVLPTTARPQAPRLHFLPRFFRSVAVAGSAVARANRFAQAYESAAGPTARQRVAAGFLAELNRGAGSIAGSRTV